MVKLDSCSAPTHLNTLRNSLVIEVKFFGRISKVVRIKEIARSEGSVMTEFGVLPVVLTATTLG